MADAPGKRAAAFFDVDGTLIDTTIVHYYKYFMSQRLSMLGSVAWYPQFFARCLYYLLLDRVDRFLGDRHASFIREWWHPELGGVAAGDAACREIPFPEPRAAPGCGRRAGSVPHTPKSNNTSQHNPLPGPIWGR